MLVFLGGGGGAKAHLKALVYGVFTFTWKPPTNSLVALAPAILVWLLVSKAAQALRNH